VDYEVDKSAVNKKNLLRMGLSNMYNKIVIELESELNPHRELMGQSA